MIKIIKQILKIIFPRECYGCGQLDTLICSECLKRIPLRPYQKEKIRHQDYLDRVLISSFYSHPLVPKLIEQFKYYGQSDLALPLGQIMLNFIKRNKLDKTLANFYLVPLPLHRRRLLERGFNQSKLLADFLSKSLSLPVIADNLWRKKYRKQQVKLSAAKRLNNIKGAFAVHNKKELFGKKILLVDDVVTTGASLNEAAKILREAGVSSVWAITIAKN